MALIYNASFDSTTRVLSLLDKAGNVISSCEVPSNDVDDATKPLMFKSQTNGATISTNATNLDFSRNGTDWETYTADTALEVNSGGRVFFKARTNASSGTLFTITGEFKAFNNIMSVYRTDFTTHTGVGLSFANMFSGQTGLLKVPMLTPTYIEFHTFSSTFSGCTGLEEDAPLPSVLMFDARKRETYNYGAHYAVTEPGYYFDDMYSGCTGLKRIRSFENYESATNDGGNGRLSLEQCLSLATNHMFTLRDTAQKKDIYMSVKFPVVLDIQDNGSIIHDTNIGNTPNEAITEPFYLKYTQDWNLWLISSLSYNYYGSYVVRTTAYYEISYDGIIWQPKKSGYDVEHGTSLSIPANQKVYIRKYRVAPPVKTFEDGSASKPLYISGLCPYRGFRFVEDCEIGGDVKSLDSANYYELQNYSQNLTSLFSCTIVDKYRNGGTLATRRYPCIGLTKGIALGESGYASLDYMYSDCSALSEVRIKSTSVTSLRDWVYGVSASGNFYADPSTTLPSGASGIPVGWERWVYGVEDTGTTTMYHNGVAETVRVGTSSYGTCYSAQGWAGFKLLSEMHVLGYTLGAQTPLTMYNYDSPVSAYSCAANNDDSFTETMYDVGDGQGYLTIAQQNANGYYLTSTPYTGLTLTATADNSSVKLTKVGTLSNAYEVNVGSGWTAYTFGTVINLNNGQSCKWRCSAHPTTQTYQNYIQFVMTGTIEASGNCNSMLSSDFDNMTSLSGYNYAFYRLFLDCTALTQAPNLPATTLAERCYVAMFNSCTALTQAPELPATTLSNYCYNGMFYHCESLTQAPELPATSIAEGCYFGMFNGTALSRAPELPATVLYTNSYREMFMGCALLSEAHIAATNISAMDCLLVWLDSVSATGDFYCDPNTNFPLGVNGIPVGWNRWVLGAEDTGTTTTMYHNGTTENVRVGTSSYGACYALQGWAGFKSLAEMHDLGYTLQAPVSTTMYHNGSTTSVDKIEANGADGFTEDMYVLNSAVKSLAEMHDLGYSLQAPVSTTMYHNGSTTTIDKIEANGADGFTEDMYILNGALNTLAQMHSSGYTLGAQTPLTMYHYEDPVSAYSCGATQDDGFTETMYDVGNGQGYLTIAQQNVVGYFLSATPELLAPLHFVALENSSVYMRQSNNTSALYNSYEYSFDQISWTQVTTNTVIQIPSGSTIYFRNGNTAWKNRTGFGDTDCFVFTGSVEAYGNVLSLLNKNFESITNLTPYGGYAFTNLFNCSRDWMTTANQNALKKLPLLPATTLANYCYAYMFMKNYQAAMTPELPATTLKPNCYEGMFGNCSSLAEVRIAATTTATDALKNWLNGVAATGDFYCDPSATIFPTDSVSGIPQNWTRHALADYPVTP